MTRFDLEDRTLEFAKSVRNYTKSIKLTIQNMDDVKQLIRSSGSIGANYIEANEAISKKDFLHRLKISRKEAKETIYWLKLISPQNENLTNEAHEITRIIGSIISKVEKK